MTEIIVKKGTYAGDTVKNRRFKMTIPPKQGKKGLYVTVLGDPLGYPERKIRILLDREQDVTFIDPREAAPEPEVEAEVEETIVEETDEEIMDRMRKKFGVLDGMTLAAVEGHVRAMIVTGPPGVGKSFGVEKILESLDVMDKMCDTDKYDADGEVKRGVEKVASASAIGLYQLLYEYRAEGSVLVLDDSDSLLYDETGLNMFKAATDSGEKRTMSWRTESRILDDLGIPFRFEFKGSIIFITNLDFEKSRGKIGDHLKAIVSRCHYLDMGIHDAHEKFLRCKQIIRDGMLDKYEFDDFQINEILEYIEANSRRLRELSLRMVKKIADLVNMDPTGWRDYADQTCLKGR